MVNNIQYAHNPRSRPVKAFMLSRDQRFLDRMTEVVWLY
jgi:hypothetical protein